MSSYLQNRNANNGVSIVTTLLLLTDRVITASDDHSIQAFALATGARTHTFAGHTGGVWALAATSNTLVSGSTDGTVRLWDIDTGRCAHVFGGHTSTIRVLALAGDTIVSGSRDHTLRVWALPKPDDPAYIWTKSEDDAPAPEENTYHRACLSGHTGAVRALAAHEQTAVSGSYDHTVRVWDIPTGECTRVLTGHTNKVFSVLLDTPRQQAYSGAMDSTVRIWDLTTGTCTHTLAGHTSLVGLLTLSPSFLLSASADSTLRLWDPSTGALKHVLAGHTGAITCCAADADTVLSGSDGGAWIWDARTGTKVRELLTGVIGIWQLAFDGRWCVAAHNRSEQTMLDIWDFSQEQE